ncbi:MAG: hypothetical protein WBX25_26650 [Rhodomicrobium sp.]
MQSRKQPHAQILPRRSLYAFRLPFAARTHALMVSSAAEITLTASTASATIADAILRQPVPIGEAAIAVALFFWLAAEIACLGAGPAIAMPEAPAVPLRAENLDRAIQRRNRLIKRGACFGAAASAAYIAAGAALGSFSIIAGGVLYLAAAWVEYSFKGELAACPRFEARSAGGFIVYAKTLLRRNPAALSGLITLPALAAFCAGLFQALPTHLAALITAGHLIAATLWSAGIAQQKTFAGNRLETARSAITDRGEASAKTILSLQPLSR